LNLTLIILNLLNNLYMESSSNIINAINYAIFIYDFFFFFVENPKRITIIYNNLMYITCFLIDSDIFNLLNNLCMENSSNIFKCH
jgi:hypothetical protein